MTGGGPRKAKPPVIRSPKESEIQEAIKEALILAGFAVRHTSAFRQKSASGVDKGIPDLLLFHPCIPGFYLGIEVKDEKGKPTPEQSAAITAGEYKIARRPSEALDYALKRVQDLGDFFTVRDMERIQRLADQFRRQGQ